MSGCDDDDGRDDDRLLRVRDLLDSDDASVQWAMRVIDRDDLVAVLSAEPNAVVQRMRAGIGRRAGDLLIEEIELYGRDLAVNIPDAERRIDAALRKLANTGRLSVSRLGIMSDAEIDRLLEGSDGDFEPIPWDDDLESTTD